MMYLSERNLYYKTVYCIFLKIAIILYENLQYLKSKYFWKNAWNFDVQHNQYQHN
jgi:hypothetical protein